MKTEMRIMPGLVLGLALLLGLTGVLATPPASPAEAYAILHNFVGTDDGWDPRGDVTFAGSRLFGWTYGGGAYGNGVFFSYQLPWTDPGMLQLLLLY